MSPRRTALPPRRTALLIGLLALALYLPDIGWGLPHATAPDRHFPYATDDILPLGPLAEMHNTFVASKPDRNYGYPWLHYLIDAIAQAPYLAWLRASGGLRDPAPEYPYGLTDPVAALANLTLIGRALSALMGAGVAVASYRFARSLFGQPAGVLAGLLTATGFRVAYYSGTGNIDVPGAFWSTLGLVAFAEILVHGLERRRTIALGVFAGLALATKDQNLVVFLPVAAALCVPRFASAPSGISRFRLLGAALLASLAAYALGTGLLVDPMRHVTHVRRLFLEKESLTAAFAYWPRVPRTVAGTTELVRSFLADFARTTTWPVALCAALGFVRAVRASLRHAVWIAPLLLVFLLLALPLGFVVQRYFLPIDPITDALAAYGIVSLGPPLARLRTPLAVLVLLWRLLWSVDLTWSQLHDTREPAARWIATVLRPGERIEFFGHPQAMPHLAADIRSRRVAGRTHWEGEFGHGPAVLAYLASSDAPEYLAVIPDWTSRPGMERSQDCPPEVWAALLDGTAGYALAAAFPPTRLVGDLPGRPHLDSPAVSPPVRIFVRRARAAGH